MTHLKTVRVSIAIVVLGLAFATSCAPKTAVPMKTVSAAEQGTGEAAPIYGVRLPPGYRDWTFISLARVGAPVNDMRVKLGNDAAIRAYREGRIPFPDGAIIARLAYSQAVSEDNNNAFARAAAAQGLSADAV